jgi:hypothetical protein
MAKLLPIPRKRRTREHVIADLSVNHVERYVFEAGFTAERFSRDYGYALYVTTYDEKGFIEPERMLIQLKSSDRVAEIETATHVMIDISVADFNLWRNETDPVFLILYDVPKRRALWIYIQRYFEEDPSREPAKTAKSIRISIPKRQRVNRRMVDFARRCKHNICQQKRRGVSHV